ncbi:MAG: hypothetical protein M9915_07910 [Rhizobacter sp.]|nr:hypothetical protein [Rhizobacter sp.]
MPFNRNHVRSFLAKTEIGLFESSLGADLKALSAAEVQRRIDRTRKLRDKYRDLLRRQKLATRARTGSKRGLSGVANERTAKKAKAFEETLARFEAQAKHLAAAAEKAAKKAAAKAKKSPAEAKPAAGKKKAAKTGTKAGTKASTKAAAKTAAKKRAPKKQPVPAAVVLRGALEKKRDAKVLALAKRPTRSAKAPARSPAAATGGVSATPPDVRAAAVASRINQSGMARIQGHTGTQVRNAQAKRDQLD